MRYRFGGLILMEGLVHAGAYFRNFTVYSVLSKSVLQIPALIQ